MSDSDPHALGMSWAGELGFARLPRLAAGERADLVVLGVPFDLATTNRPGARFGPRAIREQSSLSGEFGDALWPWTPGVLAGLCCRDAGDVAFRPASLEEMHAATRARAAALLASGAGIVALGGDHLVSLPLLEAHAARHGRMALLHFDAHSDTWEYQANEPLHHGNMFLKAAREGLIDPARSLQIGIRTPNQTHGFNVLDMNALEGIDSAAIAARIRATTQGLPVYLTVDIDALDPAFAPATGTPVAGGLSTTLLRAVLHRIAGLGIVGGDVVEVAPHYEGPAQITALAGATIAQDLLHLLACARATAPLDRDA
jgi:agmatinase